MQRSAAARAAIIMLLSLSGLVAASGPAFGAVRLVEVPGPNGGPFTQPVTVISPPGDTAAAQVFVAQRDGLVYVIDHGVAQPTPWADLRQWTTLASFNGLMSFAFDPDYATNGIFYGFHTDDENDPRSPALHDSVVDAFRRDTGTGVVTKVREIIRMEGIDLASPCVSLASSHFGGQMQFSTDGTMYVSTGDRDDAGAPCQDLYLALDVNDRHGKILRIKPTPLGTDAFAVPSDNPLASGSGVEREVFAYGLRNPWRFDLDPEGPNGGSFIVGDVGDHDFEEVTVQPLETVAGHPRFLGWPCVEGTEVHHAPADCKTIGGVTVPDAPAAPAVAYPHHGGCAAVTGGIVVRDPSVPDLDGRYIWTYWCGHGNDAGTIFSADPYATSFTPSETPLRAALGAPPKGPSSFGQDGCGHPYAMSNYSGGGFMGLWRIEGSTPGSCGLWRAPNTSIVSGPASKTTATSATLTYSATEGGSTYACTLDGAPLSCGTSGTVTVTGLVEGQHTFTVAATNEANLTDATPASTTWVVDRRDPETTITSGPAGDITARSATFAFDADDRGARFQCSLDYAAATPCSSPITYNNLALGAHAFLVAAVDAGGRADASAATRSFRVVSAITAPPPGGGGGDGATALGTTPSTDGGTTAPGTTPGTDGGTTAPGTTPGTDRGGGVDASGSIAVVTRPAFAGAVRRARIGKDGRVAITIATLPKGAHGVLTARRSGKTVGHRDFTAATGRTTVVELKLPAALRRTLRRTGSVKVTFRITLSTGGSTSATFTVRTP